MGRGEPLGPDAERYLAEAAAALQALPVHARDEVLAELRAHLVRWCDEEGRLPETLTYAEVEAELGAAALLGAWSAPPEPAQPSARFGVWPWPRSLRSWAAAAAILPVAVGAAVLAHAVAGRPPVRVATTGAAVHAASSSSLSASATASAGPPAVVIPAQVAVEADRQRLESEQRLLTQDRARLAAEQQTAVQDQQALARLRAQIAEEQATEARLQMVLQHEVALQRVNALCATEDPAPLTIVPQTSATGPITIIRARVAADPACVPPPTAPPT